MIINLSHDSCTRYILPSEHLIYPIDDENRDINGVILKRIFLQIQIMSKEKFNIQKMQTRLDLTKFNVAT